MLSKMSEILKPWSNEEKRRQKGLGGAIGHQISSERRNLVKGINNGRDG